MCPILSPCEAARRVAAVCRLPEAAVVRERIPSDVLWLTWVQWRALGREAMTHETGLSLWTITERLREMRQAGVPVPSWAEERDQLARGRFFPAYI